MSIKDLLALADDKLKDVFHTKGYDPAKDRAKHATSIDKDAASFSNGATRGKRQWKAGNNVVEYQSRFPIEGKTTHYVPSERFTDFLTKLKNLVTEGHFDKEFETAGDTPPTRSTTPRAKRSDAGAGWSDERRARFAASIEARKKAKAAAAN